MFAFARKSRRGEHSFLKKKVHLVLEDQEEASVPYVHLFFWGGGGWIRVTETGSKETFEDIEIKTKMARRWWFFFTCRLVPFRGVLYSSYGSCVTGGLGRNATGVYLILKPANERKTGTSSVTTHA